MRDRLRVLIRPLRASDFDRVLELERELFGRGAWTYGMLADELAGLGRWYIVAEPDPLDAVGPQPVIGYAGLWFDGDVTQIMTIGTAPEVQHRGVGRALMDALIRRSREVGAEAVLLEVRVDNEPALAMYEALGFRRLGVRKRYYQPEDVDAYTMRLDLDRADAGVEDVPDADGPHPDGAETEGPGAVAPEAAPGTGTAGWSLDKTRGEVLVSAAALRHLMAAEHVTILDVRWELGRADGAERYAAGHIPGAVYVDLDTELAAAPSPGAGRHPLPDADALEAAARRWGVGGIPVGSVRHDPVVVYDANGGLSAARAWWLLRWAGHTNVHLLDGGLDAWVRLAEESDERAGERRVAGEPVAETPAGLEQGHVIPEPAAEPFVVDPGHMALLDAEGAAGLVAEGVLLDARAPERYRGDVEPIDPRAGHIPGAVNASTGANLAPDGTFLPDAELRARFAGLGIVPGAGGVGVYCGSGVTAAHEVAALASIGVNAALYAGSWSQWSADPARAVETTPPAPEE